VTPELSGIADVRQVGYSRFAFDRSAAELPTVAQHLFDSGFRLALVAGHDDGYQLRVVYLFTAPGRDRRIEAHVAIPTDDPTIPSLAAWSFPASRFEREVQDLFGILPENHPQPARLVLHQHWPAGWHPMRRNSGPPPSFEPETRPFPFTPVEGPGVYEIPVGPVHAGLIEPGHFRFSAVGETILTMKARLWFVHKGLEKLFERRTPTAGLPLAERISGDTAVGHAWAYSQAVEDALSLAIPSDAHLLRAILLELERLHNHVADVGALCNDVGFGIVHAHSQRIREGLLRINAGVTGHRLLRDGIFPGGATVRRTPNLAEIDAIADDFAEVVDVAVSNSTVVDRFTETSVLSKQHASEIGVLGYVARASGLGTDARAGYPPSELEPFYRELQVPCREEGDVMARFQIRVDEFRESIRLLHRLIDAIDGRSLDQRVPLPDSTSSSSSGVGIIEGWRGTIVHRLEMVDGYLSRVKVVDPSFLNWPALAVSLADTIVPDFPLTNKSFNLSYAGNDL
jgi:Ni,Fe-hydrogenase III large subunit/Ni,Fe-hydrogenase III component G